MLTKDKADKLIEIFVTVDDFLKDLEAWLPSSDSHDFKMPRFEGRMSASEVMSIIIFYQFSGYKCFQYYFTEFVQHDLLDYFPEQVGYKRFLQLISKSSQLLFIFSKWTCVKSKATGNYFVDSKKLPACHNRRIHNRKVFKDLAG